MNEWYEMKNDEWINKFGASDGAAAAAFHIQW